MFVQTNVYVVILGSREYYMLKLGFGYYSLVGDQQPGMKVDELNLKMVNGFFSETSQRQRSQQRH